MFVNTFENPRARPLPRPRLGLVVEDLHPQVPQPVVPQVEGEVGHVGEHVYEVDGQLLDARVAHHEHQLVPLDPLERVQGQRVQLGAGQLQLLQFWPERAVDLMGSGQGQFSRLRDFAIEVPKVATVDPESQGQLEMCLMAADNLK